MQFACRPANNRRLDTRLKIQNGRKFRFCDLICCVLAETRKKKIPNPVHVTWNRVWRLWRGLLPSLDTHRSGGGSDWTSITISGRRSSFGPLPTSPPSGRARKWWRYQLPYLFLGTVYYYLDLFLVVGARLVHSVAHSLSKREVSGSIPGRCTSLCGSKGVRSPIWQRDGPAPTPSVKPATRACPGESWIRMWWVAPHTPSGAAYALGSSGAMPSEIAYVGFVRRHLPLSFS